MIIKNIIADTMRVIGRADSAENYESGEYGEEEARLARTLLFCFNAVADELARGYFPASTEEDMTSSGGKYAFSYFNYTPVKILSVKSGGKPVDWRIYPTYLYAASNKITVVYNYVPKRAEENGEYFYPDPCVGERIFTCGMAAEFYLISGDIENAAAWEDRYRQEIDRHNLLSKPSGRVAPRRWL